RQPLEPDSLRRPDDQLQTTKVAVDAEVVEVTLESPAERCVLVLDRQMSMASAPIGDGLDGPSEARTPCLAPYHPSSIPGATPIQGESEKVEGGRTLATLLPCQRTPEEQQARLVRMLVDRLQHFAQGILHELVLERRNPNRPRFALALRDVDATDRLV